MHSERSSAPAPAHRRPRLEDLLGSPLAALAAAERELVEAGRRSIVQFLEADAEGRLRPEMIELPVAAPGSQVARVRMARAALHSLSALRLEEGHVGFVAELVRSVRAPGVSEPPRFEAVLVPPADRRRPGRRGACLELDLKVKRRPATEAWRRIEHRLNLGGLELS